MDPVTMAIVASLAVGVAGGATEVGRKVIVDTYEALKAVIKQKYGEDSDLAEAMANIEKKPDSEARKGVLQEEVEAVQAHKDPELLKVAQALLDQLKAQPGGEQTIQMAIGSYIAQADRGGQASVNVNQPPKEQA